MENTQPITWQKLKDFCNNLPESELEKKVILWREDAEDVITEIMAEQLSEDQYVNIENAEDGCFDKSEAESQIRMMSDDYPDGMEHFRKVYDKGHPILFEIF